MRINTIRLFKVPFSRDYSNVYSIPKTIINQNNIANDDKTFNDFLSNLLTTQYEYYQINLAVKLRYIKINKKIDLTITLDDNNDIVRDIMNYNYMQINVFENNSETVQYRYYYFIDDYSFNDNYDKVTFTLSWDSWLNNLRQIQSTTEEQFCERRHITEWKEKAEYLPNRYKPIGYITEDEKVGVKDTVISKPFIFGDKNQRYSLLFMKINLNQEWGVDDSGINTESIFRTIYIPYCVIAVDEYGKRYVTNIQKWKTADYPSIEYNLGYLTISEAFTNSIFIWLQENSPYVINVEMTAMPFPSFKIEGNYCIIDDVHFTGVYNHYTDPKRPSIDIAIPTLKLKSDYFKYFQPITRYREISSLPIESVYVTNPSTTNTSNYTQITYEARLLLYPYTYYRVNYGLKAVDLIQNPDTDEYDMTVYQTRKNQVRGYSHFRGKGTKNEFVSDNTGEIPYSKDSLREYLTSNRASIEASKNYSMLSTTLKSISNIGNSANIFGLGISALSAMTDISKTLDLYDANLSDKDAEADTFVSSAEYATDDILTQNIVFLSEASIFEEYKAKKLAHYFACNGVKINNYYNIRDYSRNNFDYIKTINCRIPNITNIDDRKVIENAFNNGIRIWHNFGSGISSYNAVKYFDKGYNNIPLIFFNNIQEI